MEQAPINSSSAPTCSCGSEMYRDGFYWQCGREDCRNYRYADGEAGDVFPPITDCEHKNREDGCCSHPKNMTPECHVHACPRLHPILRREALSVAKLRHEHRHDVSLLGEQSGKINRLREACHVFLEARKHNGYGMDDAERAVRAALL